MIYTITVSKQTGTTYMNHGLKNDLGGFGGTADSGMSYRSAILQELRNVPMGAEYNVEKNGKLIGKALIKDVTDSEFVQFVYGRMKGKGR